MWITCCPLRKVEVYCHTTEQHLVNPSSLMHAGGGDGDGNGEGRGENAMKLISDTKDPGCCLRDECFQDASFHVEMITR